MRYQTKTLQPLADKAAIALSLLCVVHCLALPLAIALLPSLVGFGLEDESFHRWLVIVVIPLSVFALTLGCRKHGEMGVLYLGILGLVFLCLTPLLGHEYLGEQGERVFTLIGALLIAVSHVKNFMRCRESRPCECSD